MRKTTTLLVLFGILGLLLLCGLGVRQWYICSWQGLCPIEQVNEKNGVQLIVYSAKRKYKLSDTLYFRVTVRNVSDALVILRPAQGSRGKLEPAISIILSFEETVLWHEQHPDLAYREIPLPPGEEVVTEFQISSEEWEPAGTERWRILVRSHIIVFTMDNPPQRFSLGNTLYIRVSAGR